MTRIPIYTIGYGNRSIEEFIALLQRYEIQYLVDIRSQPYSRFSPNFSQKALQQHLKQHNIGYIFMGNELGGRPPKEERDCYKDDDTVNYIKLAEKPFYKRGIERIQTAYAKQLCVALMCSELKPTQCHRGKLVGETLAEKGVDVVHIDETGEIREQDKVRDILESNEKGQPFLPGFSDKMNSSRKAYPDQRKKQK